MSQETAQIGVALAALVTSLIALILVIAQVLLQYFSTGHLIRLCDSVVFGPLPGQGKRVWELRQWRFRILYSMPQISLDPKLFPSVSPHIASYAIAKYTLPELFNAEDQKHLESYGKVLTLLLSLPYIGPLINRVRLWMHQSGKTPSDSDRQRGGEAAWVSFYLAVKDTCTDSIRIDLMNGDADRCPPDLTTVPMLVSMRDIIVMSLSSGMEVSHSSLDPLSLSMQGTAGSITTSMHSSLGPIIHFSPRPSILHSDSQELLRGAGTLCIITDGWICRLWDVCTVAKSLYSGNRRRTTRRLDKHRRRVSQPSEATGNAFLQPTTEKPNLHDDDNDGNEEHRDSQKAKSESGKQQSDNADDKRNFGSKQKGSTSNAEKNENKTGKNETVPDESSGRPIWASQPHQNTSRAKGFWRRRQKEQDLSVEERRVTHSLEDEFTRSRLEMRRKEMERMEEMRRKRMERMEEMRREEMRRMQIVQREETERVRKQNEIEELLAVPRDLEMEAEKENLTGRQAQHDTPSDRLFSVKFEPKKEQLPDKVESQDQKDNQSKPAPIIPYRRYAQDGNFSVRFHPKYDPARLAKAAENRTKVQKHQSQGGQNNHRNEPAMSGSAPDLEAYPKVNKNSTANQGNEYEDSSGIDRTANNARYPVPFLTPYQNANDFNNREDSTRDSQRNTHSLQQPAGAMSNEREKLAKKRQLDRNARHKQQLDDVELISSAQLSQQETSEAIPKHVSVPTSSTETERTLMWRDSWKPDDHRKTNILVDNGIPIAYDNEASIKGKDDQKREENHNSEETLNDWESDHYDESTSDENESTDNSQQNNQPEPQPEPQPETRPASINPEIAAALQREQERKQRDKERQERNRLRHSALELSEMSPYWFSQIDIIDGCWATHWKAAQGMPSNTSIVGAITVILEAMLGFLDSDSLRYIEPVGWSGQMFRDAASWLADGQVTYPAYGMNARKGVIATGELLFVRIDAFLEPIPTLDLLYNYKYQISNPSARGLSLSRLQNAELVRIDAWLSYVGRMREIVDGDASLLDATPTMVELVIDEFELDFLNIDLSAEEGGLQDIQGLTANLMDMLLDEMLSGAEQLYMLVALLRTFKVCQAISSGQGTKMLRSVLLSDMQAHLV